MSKLTEAINLLGVFKQEGCDFDELNQLEHLLLEYEKENTITKCDTAKDNRITTVYDKIVAGMTMQELANLNVKMVLLNLDECWWMTSSGQLYPFAHKQMALQHELHYLSQELEMPA